jgi:hypothetical protein
VDLSGVIFVVLAVAWAGFLIPKLLRHHDEVARTRAVDRFSPATRVLARREPVDGREARLVVTQSTTAYVEATADAAAPRPAQVAAHRRATRAAARRRRRILGLLLLALAGVGVATALAALPPWSVAIPGGVTVVYLGLCRVLVRREHRAWDRAARSMTGEPGSRAGGTSVETTGTVAVPEPDPATHSEARNAQGFAEVSAHEDTVTLRAEELRAAASLWDPLPITLPTYVGKPKARRTVRTIDLTARDVSSSGRDAEGSRLVAEDASSDDVAEPRRAVGS